MTRVSNKIITKDNMRANFVPLVLKPAKCQGLLANDEKCSSKMNESTIDGKLFCNNPYCPEFLKCVDGVLKYKKQVKKCQCYLHADLKALVRRNLLNR